MAEKEAHKIAWEAFEINRHSPRGHGLLIHAGQKVGFYVYDNRPTETRDERYNTLFCSLTDYGAAYMILAEVTYPTSGPEVGHTIAFVVHCLGDDPEQVMLLLRARWLAEYGMPAELLMRKDIKFEN